MSRRYYWDWDSWKVWSYLKIHQKTVQEMVAECVGAFILVVGKIFSVVKLA